MQNLTPAQCPHYAKEAFFFEIDDDDSSGRNARLLGFRTIAAAKLAMYELRTLPQSRTPQHAQEWQLSPHIYRRAFASDIAWVSFSISPPIHDRDCRHYCGHDHYADDSYCARADYDCECGSIFHCNGVFATEGDAIRAKHEEYTQSNQARGFSKPFHPDFCSHVQQVELKY